MNDQKNESTDKNTHSSTTQKEDNKNKLQNKVNISQTVAILMDGNNIERSIHSESKNTNSMLNIDTLIPKLLDDRTLNRMVYFREGKHISSKLSERLHQKYHGSVRPCHKSADIPLTIKATQLASKVDTIIIMSGDSDFVELVQHLQAMGVRVEIAAVKSTTSSLLTDAADFFHQITKEHWFTLPNRNNNYRNKNRHNYKNYQQKNTHNPQQQNSSSDATNIKTAVAASNSASEQKIDPTTKPSNVPNAVVVGSMTLKQEKPKKVTTVEAPPTKKTSKKKATKKKVVKKSTTPTTTPTTTSKKSSKKDTKKKTSKKITKKKVSKKTTKKKA